MPAYDGTIKIDSSINSKGFNQGIKSMVGSLRGLAAAVGIAFGIGVIVNFGKTAVNEASNMASALVGLQSVAEATGSSFQTAKTFIDDYVEDGLVPAQAAITAYKTLLAKGFDASGIEKILNVTKDTAVFNRQAGLTIGEAIQRTAEGIKNENSVLTDSGGITKNLSIIYQEYANSIGKTVTALTEAEKRQAVLNGFEREGAIFAGDAAKAAGTYAGQMSALSTSLLNMKVAAGNAIIPVIQKILPYIRAAVDALTFFFNRVATIVGILFGVEIGAGAANTTAALEDNAGAANDAAAAQENLGKATKKADKERKGALASFDQLNVLQQQNADTADGTGTGAGGAGGDLGLGGGAILPELDTTKFDAGLDDMRAKVLQWKTDFLAFIQPARDAFGRLIEAIKPLAATIWSGLQWAWENILKPLGEWAVQNLAPAAFDLLGSAAITLNDILLGLQPTAQWLWDNFLKPLAEWTGATLIAAIEQITEWLQNLHEWIGKNQEAWQAIVAVLAIVAAAIFIALFPINLTALAIAALIAGIIILIAYWDQIGPAIKSVWDSIVEWFGGIGDWFQEHVTDPIKEKFQTALDFVKERFSSIFEGIKGIVKIAINGVIAFINRMLSGIADGINTISGIAGALGVSIPTMVAPQIPYLAKGAVIPPNAQFAAILGDQKSGRNIEAPESLIRQIVREEVGQVTADVNITFDGSLGELVRILKPRMDRENIRIGPNLAKGSA